MNKYRFLTALLLGVIWASAPLTTALAEAKKSSSTSKKKGATPTPSPAKKKNASATKSKAGEAPADTNQDDIAPDLPLPKKTTPSVKTSATGEESAGAKSSSSATSKSVDEKKEEPAPSAPAPAASSAAAFSAAVKPERAPAAVVEPEAIAEFAKQPERIQQLIRAAIDLTRQNLTYTFGSADPSRGGMDCSGTMYYLLRTQGFESIPRDSSGQYLWARKSGAFFPVVGKSADSEEFKQLQPGDLMFWTGTYQTGREIPISHVMLYLGREKKTGKPIMFGASDGRSYNGVQRWGVSVFDFKMPRTDSADLEKAKVDFVGYARTPGLREAVVAVPEIAAVEEPRVEEPKPAAITHKPKAKTQVASSTTVKKKSAKKAAQ